MTTRMKIPVIAALATAAIALTAPGDVMARAGDDDRGRNVERQYKGDRDVKRDQRKAYRQQERRDQRRAERKQDRREFNREQRRAERQQDRREFRQEQRRAERQQDRREFRQEQRRAERRDLRRDYHRDVRREHRQAQRYYDDNKRYYRKNGKTYVDRAGYHRGYKHYSGRDHKNRYYSYRGTRHDRDFYKYDRKRQKRLNKAYRKGYKHGRYTANHRYDYSRPYWDTRHFFNHRSHYNVWRPYYGRVWNGFHQFIGFNSGYRNDCHPVTRVKYRGGAPRLVGAIMCYDRYGDSYILRGSRHVLHYY
ncbi:MAG: hypothetical protein ACE363_08490 [Alphaproteobacteria bacterium]